jgi:hypothetical protein
MSDEQPVTELIHRADAGDTEALLAVIEYFQIYMARACLKAISNMGLQGSVQESEVLASIHRIVKTGFMQGKFANVANRDEFRAMLITIVSGRAVDAKRYEGARRRGGNQRKQVRDDAVLDQIEARDVLPDVAAACQDWFDRIKKPLESWEQAMVDLILQSHKWVEIPKLLLPEHGKITKHMLDCAREKLKRVLTRELAQLE